VIVGNADPRTDPPHLRSKLSKVSIYLETSFEAGTESHILGSATGCLHKEADSLLLVTNWHVVSGKNPATSRILSASKKCPTHITAFFAFSETRGVRWHKNKFSLFNEASPTWFEHPVHGRVVDVIAMPVMPKPIDGSELFNLAVTETSDDPLLPEPGMDCFILGFPEGVRGPGRLPIWKRATIAVEPDFDCGGLPMTLVDTATRRGMSGAPTYAQYVGMLGPDGSTSFAERIDESSLGVHTAFLGIYSNRLGRGEHRAQLGAVWKPTAIRQIIESRRPGENPHIIRASH
jgi:hypothetical protein